MATGGIQTNTYAYLYSSALWIKNTEAVVASQTSKKISCLVMLAHSLEAFLNHCCARVIPFWNAQVEQCSFSVKMAMLEHELSLTLESGRRPLQTVYTLVRLRNELAHGKTHHQEISPERREELVKRAASLIDQCNNDGSGHEDLIRSIPQTAKWEAILGELQLERSFEDVMAFFKLAWEAAGWRGEILTLKTVGDPEIT